MGEGSGAKLGSEKGKISTEVQMVKKDDSSSGSTIPPDTHADADTLTHVVMHGHTPAWCIRHNH